jgi:hypothetical protein
MATSYADSAQARELDRRFEKKETSHLRRDFDPELFHEYDAQAVVEREREYRKDLARRIGLTITKMEAHLERNKHES